MCGKQRGFGYYTAKAIFLCLWITSIHCEGTLKEKRFDGDQGYDYISLLPPDDEASEEYSGYNDKSNSYINDPMKKTFEIEYDEDNLDESFDSNLKPERNQGIEYEDSESDRPSFDILSRPGGIQKDNTSESSTDEDLELEENEEIFRFLDISPETEYKKEYEYYYYEEYVENVPESIPIFPSITTVVSEVTEREPVTQPEREIGKEPLDAMTSTVSMKMDGGDSEEDQLGVDVNEKNDAMTSTVSMTTEGRDSEEDQLGVDVNEKNDAMTSTVSMTTEGRDSEEDQLGVDVNEKNDVKKSTMIEKATEAVTEPFDTEQNHSTRQYNTIEPTTTVTEDVAPVTKEVLPAATILFTFEPATEKQPRKTVKIVPSTTTKSADFYIETDETTSFPKDIQFTRDYITSTSVDKVHDIVITTEPVIFSADAVTTIVSTAKQLEFSTSRDKTSKQTLVQELPTTIADYEISSEPQDTIILTSSYAEAKLPFITEGFPEIKSKPSTRSPIPPLPITEEISFVSLTTLADDIPADENETATASGSVSDREAARIADFSTLILIICLISVAIVFVFIIVVIVLVHTRLRRRGKYAIAAESDSGASCEGKMVAENGKSGIEDRRTEAVVPVHYNDSVA